MLREEDVSALDVDGAQGEKETALTGLATRVDKDWRGTDGIGSTMEA